MNTETVFTYIGIAISVVLLILIIIRIRKVLAWCSDVIKDTCRGKDGKWSLTSIMMIVAFDAALILIFYDEFKQNKLNEFAIISLLVLATTGKIATAKAKQIDPTIQPPKDEIKSE